MFGLNPGIEVILIAIIVSAASAVVSRLMVDQRELKRMQARIKELQKADKEARIKGEKPAMESTKEMMTIAGKQMKMQFKPMMITILPLLILISFVLPSFYGNYAAAGQSAEHEYYSAGTYNVMLQVQNSSNVTKYENQVAVSETDASGAVLLSTESFNATAVGKLDVKFDASAKPDESYSWNFGDELIGSIPVFGPVGWFGMYFFWAIVGSFGMQIVFKIKDKMSEKKRGKEGHENSPFFKKSEVKSAGGKPEEKKEQ
ncbi:MAG: EMC3/TMCO1 family protein [Candidatus Micrarchaeota archaeon]